MTSFGSNLNFNPAPPINRSQLVNSRTVKVHYRAENSSTCRRYPPHHHSSDDRSTIDQRPLTERKAYDLRKQFKVVFSRLLG